MDISQRVLATQKALKVAGISVRQFCFRAGIAPKTWRRWRDGTSGPQLRKWLEVEATLEAIRSEARQAKARKRAARKAAAERKMKQDFLEAAERALKPPP